MPAFVLHVPFVPFAKPRHDWLRLPFQIGPHRPSLVVAGCVCVFDFLQYRGMAGPEHLAADGIASVLGKLFVVAWDCLVPRCAVRNERRPSGFSR
jgi:hypothetical protein